MMKKGAILVGRLYKAARSKTAITKMQSVVFAVVIVVAALIGGGVGYYIGQQTVQSHVAGLQKVKITFAAWVYAPELVQEFIDAFEERYPWIEVEYLTFPSEQYHDKLVTMFTTGTGPDVFYARDEWLGEFVEAGWVMPLDELMGSVELSAYKDTLIPGAIEAMSYKGRLYGFPYYARYEFVLYNKEMFQQAGITKLPETCLLYTSDAADELDGVDIGGRRIIKKKK